MLIINKSNYADITQYFPLNENARISIFTQFFIAKTKQRNDELQECLKRNCMNSNIDKIYLLNEKIYSYNELGIQNLKTEYINKIHQINIITDPIFAINTQTYINSPLKTDKRLSFKDVFKFIRFSSIRGFYVITNMDIFFDETISNLLCSTISIKEQKQMFALTRFEFRNENDLTKCPLFGPRMDSQDTWIFHSSMVLNSEETISPRQFNPYIFETNLFDIQFGKPGVDNKLIYLMQVLGIETINDCEFIKTYHYHTSTSRDYTNKDRIEPPYSLIVPSGKNFLTIQPSLGCTPAIIVQSTNGFNHMMFNDNDILYNYINKKIQNNQPFIIPRISGHENNYAFIGKIIEQNGGNIPNPEVNNYIQNTITIMKTNAGIKISNIESIIKYSKEYLAAFENCEIYGGWEKWGRYIKHIENSHDFILRTFKSKQIFWSYALDIFHYIFSKTPPYTLSMQGKRILIVSCFNNSIRKKIPIREKIYGIDLFPNCEFVFITPPITNGNNDSLEFNVELERFYKRLYIIKNDYDIALLSCGGYANLIANYIYTIHRKSAIYVGGVLQMYFGVYGNRWLIERSDVLKLFLNNHWSRPTKEEVEQVSNSTSIENGCYW
jgi:hypothetical protein